LERTEERSRKITSKKERLKLESPRLETNFDSLRKVGKGSKSHKETGKHISTLFIYSFGIRKIGGKE
jgi:hypothetical protein